MKRCEGVSKNRDRPQPWKKNKPRPRVCLAHFLLNRRESQIDPSRVWIESNRVQSIGLRYYLRMRVCACFSACCVCSTAAMCACVLWEQLGEQRMVERTGEREKERERERESVWNNSIETIFTSWTRVFRAIGASVFFFFSSSHFQRHLPEV